MYIPSHFKVTNEDSIVEFINQYPFGILSMQIDDKVVASHLPFVIEKKEDIFILSSHLSVMNELGQVFENKEVLLIFSEPQSYISPKNYDSDQNVPTWNYLAVHLYGKVSILGADFEKEEALKKMISIFEKDYFQKWEKLEKEYKQAHLNGIVAFEVKIEEIQFQKKASQNKSAKEREHIKKELENSSISSAKEMAKYMDDKTSEQ